MRLKFQQVTETVCIREGGEKEGKKDGSCRSHQERRNEYTAMEATGRIKKEREKKKGTMWALGEKGGVEKGPPMAWPGSFYNDVTNKGGGGGKNRIKLIQ